MAKKSQALFDTFRHVKSVRQGETLRFRSPNGKITKFDGRKKLIAEIWFHGKKTDRVLNKTKNKKPVPQKFPARQMKKRVHFLRAYKAGRRIKSEPQSMRVNIDSRYTIIDNVEAKCGRMLDDVITYSKRGNGAFLTTEFKVTDEDGEELFETINMVVRGRRGFISLEIARNIIARMYKHKKRMSSIQKSPLGRRAKYVRSLPIKFTWDETKRLQDM